MPSGGCAATHLWTSGDWVSFDQTMSRLAAVSTSPSETVAKLAEPAAATEPATPIRARRLRSLAPDLLIGALLVATATVGVFGVRRVVTRPLWYDEQWRGGYLHLPGPHFLGPHRPINAPNRF